MWPTSEFEKHFFGPLIIMSSLIPSWPYPPSRHGYWGHVSSTINWCEEVIDFSQRISISCGAASQMAGTGRFAFNSRESPGFARKEAMRLF